MPLAERRQQRSQLRCSRHGKWSVHAVILSAGHAGCKLSAATIHIGRNGYIGLTSALRVAELARHTLRGSVRPSSDFNGITEDNLKAESVTCPFPNELNALIPIIIGEEAPRTEIENMIHHRLGCLFGESKCVNPQDDDSSLAGFLNQCNGIICRKHGGSATDGRPWSELIGEIHCLAHNRFMAKHS